MTKVNQNDLLDAIAAAIPAPPAAEWMTILEIQESLQINSHQAHRRIQRLEKEGKLERIRAPRRSDGASVAIYYRLKRL